MSNVDLYQSQLRQRQTEIVKRLRVFIARRYPDLAESFKWNVPTYSLNGKSIMGLQDSATGPKRVLQGTGKQVRHVSFRSIDDISHNSLTELVDQAIINV